MPIYMKYLLQGCALSALVIVGLYSIANELRPEPVSLEASVVAALKSSVADSQLATSTSKSLTQIPQGAQAITFADSKVTTGQPTNITQTGVRLSGSLTMYLFPYSIAPLEKFFILVPQGSTTTQGITRFVDTTPVQYMGNTSGTIPFAFNETSLTAGTTYTYAACYRYFYQDPNSGQTAVSDNCGQLITFTTATSGVELGGVSNATTHLTHDVSSTDLGLSCTMTNRTHPTGVSDFTFKSASIYPTPTIWWYPSAGPVAYLGGYSISSGSWLNCFQKIELVSLLDPGTLFTDIKIHDDDTNSDIVTNIPVTVLSTHNVAGSPGWTLQSNHTYTTTITLPNVFMMLPNGTKHISILGTVKPQSAVSGRQYSAIGIQSITSTTDAQAVVSGLHSITNISFK